MQKIYSIQAARAIATLMVVAFHGLRIQEKYLQTSPLLPGFLEIGQTGVDLFFVISGFIMVLISGDSSSVKKSQFLAKRFLRIYPTYWVYYIALILVFLAAPGMINSSQAGGVDLVSSFFLFPSDSLPLLLVAWSLTHEIWFYLVFAGILYAPCKLRIYCLALWAALIIFLTQFEVSSAILRVMTHTFTIEFILGACAAYAFTRLKNLRKVGLVSLGAIALAAISLGFGFSLVLEQPTNVIQYIPLSRAILVGGGYALLIASMAVLEGSGKLTTHSILKKLGDASYSIYLSHILVLSILGRAWLSIMGAGIQPLIAQIAFWLVTFSAAIFGGYVAYIMIERPILRLTLQPFKTKAASPSAASH